LKGQSETKLPVKASCSKKMTVLSAFLELLLNFLSNNLKKLQDLEQLRRKAVSNLVKKKQQAEKLVF